MKYNLEELMDYYPHSIPITVIECNDFFTKIEMHTKLRVQREGVWGIILIADIVVLNNDERKITQLNTFHLNFKYLVEKSRYLNSLNLDFKADKLQISEVERFKLIEKMRNHKNNLVI